MAQYDVYANPFAGMREFVPFVVDVQSALIDQLPTRLVIPLSRVGTQVGRLPTNLCPTLDVDGEGLSLMAHEAAPVSVRQLGRPVASVSHRASDILAAMDAVLSGL